METPTLPSAGSIIDDLGGTGVVADALVLADSTVSGWRERGIPAGRCLALSELAARKGQKEITLELLLRIADQPPAEARP